MPIAFGTAASVEPYRCWLSWNSFPFSLFFRPSCGLLSCLIAGLCSHVVIHSNSPPSAPTLAGCDCNVIPAPHRKAFIESHIASAKRLPSWLMLRAVSLCAGEGLERWLKGGETGRVCMGFPFFGRPTGWMGLWGTLSLGGRE